MLGRLGAFFLDILEVVVFSIAIFLFIYLLIFRPHKIKGASMQPNFPDAEYLLTEKVTYYLNPPKRGDVVVFKPPATVSEDEFIKRIIGLPGEKIMVKDNHVYINGKKLEEGYLSASLPTTGSSFLQENQEYTIPAGRFFVMGDNRTNSSDSRAWGPITKDEISGRAWLIYWPPNLGGFVKDITYNL